MVTDDITAELGELVRFVSIAVRLLSNENCSKLKSSLFFKITQFKKIVGFKKINLSHLPALSHHKMILV